MKTVQAAAIALAAFAAQAPAAREVRIASGNAHLYAREIGRGQPIVVLHGGPDFDISYLLPEMDRLADGYRLVYYDQRGRGKSAAGVRPEDVTLASEVADLDKVREHFRLGSTAVLGHSWGTVLALEYAIRHPDRVSHLILMNPAPASAEDFTALRNDRIQRLGSDLDRLRAAQASPAYQAGDPDGVTAYYRIHFKAAFARPADYEKMMTRMHASFNPDGVLKARAVEDRLMNDTWLSPGYNLLPKAAQLRIPALVIYGDHDFIPVGTSEHITQAIRNARMVTFKQCGHFAYLECPADARREIDAFFTAKRRD
jgi:proline iminopeptidase